MCLLSASSTSYLTFDTVWKVFAFWYIYWYLVWEMFFWCAWYVHDQLFLIIILLISSILKNYFEIIFRHIFWLWISVYTVFKFHISTKLAIFACNGMSKGMMLMNPTPHVLKPFLRFSRFISLNEAWLMTFFLTVQFLKVYPCHFHIPPFPISAFARFSFW